MLPSMSSCASTRKKSDLSKNMAVIGHFLFFLLSHLLRNYWVDSNETYLLCSPQWLSQSNESVTRVKNLHVFVTHVKNSNEFFTACDRYVRILHTSKIIHVWETRIYLNLRIGRTYISHIPKCDVFVRIIHCVWKNEELTKVISSMCVKGYSIIQFLWILSVQEPSVIFSQNHDFQSAP